MKNIELIKLADCFLRMCELSFDKYNFSERVFKNAGWLIKSIAKMQNGTRNGTKNTMTFIAKYCIDWTQLYTWCLLFTFYEWLLPKGCLVIWYHSYECLSSKSWHSICLIKWETQNWNVHTFWLNKVLIFRENKLNFWFQLDCNTFIIYHINKKNISCHNYHLAKVDGAKTLQIFF